MAANKSLLHQIRDALSSPPTAPNTGRSALIYDGPNDQYIFTDHNGQQYRQPAYNMPHNMTPPWVHKNPVNPSPLGSILDSEAYRHKLLAMRLRVPEGQRMPFHDLFTSLAGDKVFVFVVQDGQAVTLEDEAPLYPSDQLITQLRLLEK